jgi:AbrB family looped-hinge helix DNA binding protein
MSKTEEITVSSKGQLVIPKPMREELGIRTGSKVLIRQHDNSILILPKPKDPLEAMIALGRRLKLGDMRKELQEERRKEHR